jgi:hypothetical protein
MTHAHSNARKLVASSLRIWPASRPTKSLPPKMRPTHRPETARARINGLPFRLRHWTALAWERTPVAERPETTFEDDQGGRFALEQMMR